MTQFNESFYTDDFDQEMLDFVKENFEITDDIDEWDLTDKNLKYYTGLDYFWTGSSTNWYTKLTKQQFKDKIGMTDKESTTQQNNTFTKDMLVSGEHVVKLRDGTYNLVMGNRIVDLGGWLLLLNHLTEDLRYAYNDEKLDVIAVYTLKKDFTLNNLEDGKELTLIWQRESPEKQKQREVIQTLEEDLKRVQKALEEAKSKLEQV